MELLSGRTSRFGACIILFSCFEECSSFVSVAMIKCPHQEPTWGRKALMWFAVPGYHPLLWGSQGRDSSSQSIHRAKKRSTPMLPVAHAQLAFFTLTQFRVQRKEWCCPHPGWVFLPQLANKTILHRHTCRQTWPRQPPHWEILPRLYQVDIKKTNHYTGSCVAQASLKLAIQMRMTLDSWSICLHHLNAEITCMCHHTWFTWSRGKNPGLCVF